MLSVRCSPIFNHFFETINGVSTIRAFKKSREFREENDSRVDAMQEAFFAQFNCDRWLLMRIKVLCSLITFFAALFCVIQRDTLSPGLVGLSISYSLQVTKDLITMVKQLNGLETNIISIERIKEYIEKPREAPPIVEDNKPHKHWPGKGEISFDDYSMRYRPGLELVLKNICFNINSSEKVGIVGRTGAGKSSITLALFRILESAGGKIRIDGLDISSIGLKDLRKKLSIIPQDPVLFSGSIRFNLDPLEEHTDEEVWNALEMSHLKHYVLSLQHGLHHDVASGGNNLSVGQCQLICLARALLRKSKILVLDEATAAIDMETDSYIQQIIRSEFEDCTVLTIAHRLNTILDYDRVLVLQNGNVVEFDKPDTLLEDENTLFFDMVKTAGCNEAKKNV